MEGKPESDVFRFESKDVEFPVEKFLFFPFSFLSFSSPSSFSSSFSVDFYTLEFKFQSLMTFAPFNKFVLMVGF